MSKEKLYKFMFEHLNDFRNGVDSDYIDKMRIGNKRFICKELSKLCEKRGFGEEMKYCLRDDSAEYLAEFYRFCERQKSYSTHHFVNSSL